MEPEGDSAGEMGVDAAMIEAHDGGGDDIHGAPMGAVTAMMWGVAGSLLLPGIPLADGSVPVSSANRPGLAASRHGEFSAAEVATSTGRLALAALSGCYQEAAAEVLAPVAGRVVEVMTERVARGGQVAAVTAVLDRAGLGVGVAERRRVAMGVVDSVTAACGVNGG